MKALFDGFSEGQEDSLIRDKENALKYIMEIEIPVCINLGLCYLRLGKYHHAISYCTQALDKDDENEKALYRRGLAYLSIGELNLARKDLNQANELTQGKDLNIAKALQSFKEKESQGFS